MRSAIRTAVIALVTTAAVAIPGTAHADRSNTIGGATTVNPFFSNLSDTLGYAGDVDYWKFKTSSAGYSRITLANLPKDYALKILNASGQMVGAAQRPGTAFEEIYRYLPAGTYYVQVYSPGKLASSTAYQLRFMPLTDGVKVLSSKSYKDGIGNTWIFGELLNNTGTTKSFTKATARFYNSANQVVATGYGYADSYNMATRARATFSMVADVPSTAVRYTLTPTWNSTVSGQSVIGFTTSVTKQTISSGKFFHFEGTVTNKSGGYADEITVQNARYDKYGNITTTGSGSVLRKRSDGSSSGTLANGQVGTFSGGYYALPGTTFQIWRTTGTRSDGSGARTMARPVGFMDNAQPSGELRPSGLQDPGPTR